MHKILFDKIFACLGLLLASPLLLIIAVLILVSNGAPIIFCQTRVGRNGHDFILKKFRTMTVLRERSHDYFDAGNKNRVTNIGAFLRKTKLDELPQLWNVLKGDMSFVGPRPEVRKWVDVYPERWAKILAVRPGITDPASIYYRNEEELLAQADDPEAFYRNYLLPHKLDLYEEYVRSRTFFGDLRLIFKTLLSVLFPSRYSCHRDSVSPAKTGIPSSQ